MKAITASLDYLVFPLALMVGFYLSAIIISAALIPLLAISGAAFLLHHFNKWRIKNE